MGQVIPNVDEVSMGLSDFWRDLNVIWADGVVTPDERERARRQYEPLQRLAKESALMQRVGLSLARTGRVGKNLFTLLKSLLAEHACEVQEFEGAEKSLGEAKEKAATDWNSETAIEREQVLVA